MFQTTRNKNNPEVNTKFCLKIKSGDRSWEKKHDVHGGIKNK